MSSCLKLAVSLWILCWNWIRKLFFRHRRVIRPEIRRCLKPGRPQSNTRAWKSRPKPIWVRRQVIRLAALMPNAGCRQIADTFNRIWQPRRGVTVSKTYVAERRKEHFREIRDLRREMKNRRPRQVAKNTTWAMDLTFVRGQPILGVIDHGTRASLALLGLRTKTSIEILRAVLDCVEMSGRPRQIRTDNEACFTGRLMITALAILGIKHQRTELCAPWQNGRIERFFGTFKSLFMKHLETTNVVDLGAELDAFRAWYNHIRPHQHLEGATPAEAWDNRLPSPRKDPIYFSAWGDLLTGFFIPK